jgi:hypothetical protein
MLLYVFAISRNIIIPALQVLDGIQINHSVIKLVKCYSILPSLNGDCI